MATKLRNHLALLILLARTFTAHADDSFPNHLNGDIGLASYSQTALIKNTGNTTQLLPYTYFDYGRLFARIDTFGIKTLPLCQGYLEFSTLVRQDGYRFTQPSIGLARLRQDSLPLGIGTLQETSYGDIFLNLYHDMGASKGNLFEGLYAAELNTPVGVLYPQIGVEYLSSAYTHYYYGVENNELSNATAYTPSASWGLLAGAMLEIHITGNWYGNLYWRRKLEDTTITRSPLVTKPYQDTYFASLAYRFQ